VLSSTHVACPRSPFALIVSLQAEPTDLGRHTRDLKEAKALLEEFGALRLGALSAPVKPAINRSEKLASLILACPGRARAAPCSFQLFRPVTIQVAEGITTPLGVKCADSISLTAPVTAAASSGCSRSTAPNGPIFRLKFNVCSTSAPPMGASKGLIATD
jgi:hypothetical protein